MPEIMTTKEIAKYLKLQEVTIIKYAAEGKIPAIRIGKVWRFEKDIIDKLITAGEAVHVAGKGVKKKGAKK